MCDEFREMRKRLYHVSRKALDEFIKQPIQSISMFSTASSVALTWQPVIFVIVCIVLFLCSLSLLLGFWWGTAESIEKTADEIGLNCLTRINS